MKKYDNREEMKRILLAGNLNSNNNDSWNVRRILDGATPDFAFHGYKIHSGASKLCLCNEGGKYVCKWVTDDRYNEAVQEAKVYAKAVEAGLEKFFPYTEIAFETNGITFVFQEKVQYSVSRLPFQLEHKYNQQCKTSLDSGKRIWKKMEREFKRAGDKDYCRDLDQLWACMALTLYGKKLCRKMCAFIVENAINDLHTSNIGYNHNKPIILDFSGYDRKY